MKGALADLMMLMLVVSEKEKLFESRIISFNLLTYNTTFKCVHGLNSSPFNEDKIANCSSICGLASSRTESSLSLNKH
jgi:hypothetical protein